MSHLFPAFAALVHARYEAMRKHELFVVDTSDLFQTYLDAFPEGTNPIFRERTEHDCSCCKQFIRNIGNVVAIIDGEIVTVWDDAGLAPAPYDTVGRVLRERVRQAPIKSVWRTKERKYGTAQTNELLPDGSVRTWDHFSGAVDAPHFHVQPDTQRGNLNTSAAVLKRGLTEITMDALDTVIDLAEANNLYKGEEFLAAIKAFRQLKAGWDGISETYIWANLGDKSSRFRNSAIGTLLLDLSEGTELEIAVKKYEKVVAPANYKRPTALVTPRMIDEAVAKLDELGLRGAVNRRHARLSDVSVNDVLFVDNSAQGQMKDGLKDLLMTSAAPPKVNIDNATPISAEEFFARQHKSISVLVENRHAGNFMSITAPVDPGEVGLFKWDNDFSWSYDGDMADSSLRQKVQMAGGRVDGVLRFSHLWNDVGRNASLMDLHVFLPGHSGHRYGIGDSYGNAQRVGWNHRAHTPTGGRQDVDYTSPAPEGYVPVENITFPSLDRLPEGDYNFAIHNWHLRQPTNSGFKAEIEVGGQLYQYDHPAPMKNKEWVHLATATLKNGQWSIIHHHPTTTSSQKRWGIATETLVPVDVLMLSPNFWEGQQVGNRHWFFILRDCKNPDPVRGIYNEYLRSDLNEHRKVFEVLGSKTKAPFAEDQLSGLGFSSTQRNTLKVVADGRAFEIQF